MYKYIYIYMYIYTVIFQFAAAPTLRFNTPFFRQAPARLRKWPRCGWEGCWC